MSTDKEIYPVEVFCGNDWQTSILKSLLENAEIEVFFKDEKMGVLAPWDVTGGGAGSIKVFVSSLDLENAKEVVDEFLKAEAEN